MKYKDIIIRTALGGMSNNVSKVLIHAIPIYYFLLLRYIGMLIINYATSRKTIGASWDILKKDRKLQISLTFSSIASGLGTVFFYLGLQNLPVSVVSILDNSFHIIFVTILAIIINRQFRDLKFYIYFLLIFPSLYLIMFKDLTLDLTLSSFGVSMLILNAFVSAVEVHITKDQLKKVSVGFNVFAKTAISSLVALTCIFIFKEKWTDVVEGFSILVGILLVYNITNSLLIKYLHTKSIKELGAETTTVFTALTPLFGILFAMIIFGDWLSLTQWIGIITLLYILFKIK